VTPVRRIGALVRGRVQGVGFRYFAQAAAREQALTGWVRNTPDGDVELEAQGGEAAVAAFIDDLHRGPGTGHVSDVRVCDLPPEKSETGFEIRY
jgi:acylphosphatase